MIYAHRQGGKLFDPWILAAGLITCRQAIPDWSKLTAPKVLRILFLGLTC